MRQAASLFKSGDGRSNICNDSYIFLPMRYLIYIGHVYRSICYCTYSVLVCGGLKCWKIEQVKQYFALNYETGSCCL